MDGLGRRAGWMVWDLGMGSAVGLLSGTASAGFLWLLGRTIQLHLAHAWLLFLLPVFGLASAWLYRHWGRESEGGSALVLDEALEFRGRVRSRLAPLVLIGTLLSHLGGGSVGREGTAVQMGASLARSLGKLPLRWLRLTRSRQRLLLMAGVSAGFGSLFGTPVAGALFGMEVIATGKLHYEGLIICTVASFTGDYVARLLGVLHGHYAVVAPVLDAGVAFKLLMFALLVAAVAACFSGLSHGLAQWTKVRFELRWWLRPVVGGLLMVGLFSIFRDEGYRNLGLPFLDRIFHQQVPVAPWAFVLKLAFTVLTLGFGFKGGEVTPLFVIGALLGATVAPLVGLPPTYLAAVGWVALFASASNTPLASTLMGIELFGAAFAGPLALVCFPAYVLVGHRGIYGTRPAVG